MVFCPRYNERAIASMNMDQEDPEFRSRTSRLAKWRELVKAAQKGLQLPESAPERIVFLD